MPAALYEERVYRRQIDLDGLVATHVQQLESDLLILAPVDVRRQASAFLAEARRELEAYIARDYRFAVTLDPHPALHDAPLLVRRMAQAAAAWGVGPMAAVAGAVADCVGEQLGLRHREVVVENGGDIYLQHDRPVTCALQLGPDSRLAGQVRLRVDPAGGRLGVCTSSGMIGHSFSRGRADAVCVVATSAALADAAATAICNRIQSPADVESVIGDVAAEGALLGVVAVCGNRLGAWGAVEIV